MTALDDTMKTAKKKMDETMDDAGHAAVRARSSLLDGLHAVASAMSVIRGLGLGDALGWVGLQRRRGPAESIFSFGAGFLAGAAAGVLFAPLSGTETRRFLAERFMNMEKQAEQKVTAAVSTAAHGVEDKIGEIADGAKDTLNKAAEGASAAKQAVKTSLGEAQNKTTTPKSPTAGDGNHGNHRIS